LNQVSPALQTTTYSMWNAFRNCRKACELRYERGLTPKVTSRNLSFGSTIHSCLELWHGAYNGDLNAILYHIDQTYPDRYANEDSKYDWMNARAMMIGYVRKYGTASVEPFKVLKLEQVFTGSIINPDTNAQSRSFCMSGKVDGIIERPDGTTWLLEHKTASYLDGSYLEKLWCDMQITLYSHYLEQTFGITITGVLYNVLVKAKLQQGRGETQEEFEARYADLCAKNKNGKSSATRKLPESDDDFQGRLIEKYTSEPDGMYHREELYLSRDQYVDLQRELWELTQQYLDARRRGTWYKNTSYCFHWNSACPYFAICRSGENPLVIENEYEYCEPHEELRESNGIITEGSTVSAPPVF
jgi:hypothetical protein